MIIMGQTQAIKFTARRVCARCYAELQATPNGDGEYRVGCWQCGDAWGDATVSRRYAEKLGEKALDALPEVKDNLRDLFPLPRLTEAQILSDLGF